LTATAVREALYQVLGLGGLNLLLDSNNDGEKILTDIQLPKDDPDSTQFQLKLGKKLPKDLNFAKNIGSQNLGMNYPAASRRGIRIKKE
jgi:hypothetical protein